MTARSIIAVGLLACAMSVLVCYFFFGFVGVMSRSEAERVACNVKLRSIAQLAGEYAEEHGSLPFSDAGGLASLQLLADSCEILCPTSFVCRASHETPAKATSDGSFRLTTASCSYEYTPVPLAPGSDAPLAWCRTSHRGKRILVHANGDVLSISEEEFEERLQPLQNRSK